MTEQIIYLTRSVLGVEPCVRIRENTFEIRSGQRQVIRFFQKYGFIKGKKAYVARIPAQIIDTKDSEIIKAFLKGLFSSDGSFSFRKRDYSPRIDLVVRSRLLRDQFVALATKIGFRFNKCDAKRVQEGFTIKSAGTFFNANLCSRKEVIRWMAAVGTICDSHIKKFELWQSKV
jgi:intein/homing endonuclease